MNNNSNDNKNYNHEFTNKNEINSPKFSDFVKESNNYYNYDNNFRNTFEQLEDEDELLHDSDTNEEIEETEKEEQFEESELQEPQNSTIKKQVQEVAVTAVKNKGKEVAKNYLIKHVKNKALLKFIMKNPYVLLILGIAIVVILFLLILIIILSGDEALTYASYGSQFCIDEEYDLTEYENNGVKTWERGLRNWAYPVSDFYNNYETYTDEDGFLRVDDAYVVALGQGFGIDKGVKYEVTMKDGLTFTVILGDSKSKSDDNYDENGYGHKYGNSLNVLEFVMGCKNEGETHNLGKYKGEENICPTNVNVYNNIIEEKFPGEIEKITRLRDETKCLANGQFSEHPSVFNLVDPKTKQLIEIEYTNYLFEEVGKFSQSTVDSLRSTLQAYPYECVTYMKTRAIDILLSSKVLNDTDKQNAIITIATAKGNATYYDENSIYLKNFEHDPSCKNFQPGSVITFNGNNSFCDDIDGDGIKDYCGHVAIIESVDYETKTFIATDSYRSKAGSVNRNTYTFNTNMHGGCKNIFNLFSYKSNS